MVRQFLNVWSASNLEGDCDCDCEFGVATGGKSRRLLLGDGPAPGEVTALPCTVARLGADLSKDVVNERSVKRCVCMRAEDGEVATTVEVIGNNQGTDVTKMLRFARNTSVEV